MEMPLKEFREWMEVVNKEIERENEEIKKQKP